MILFDPYFVMYSNLVTLAGGVSVLVDTYPDFRIDAAKVAAAITAADQVRPGQLAEQPDRASSPRAEEMKALAQLCRERGVLLISDEVYRRSATTSPFATPATWNEDVLVVDGFSKSHGMTGWRLGYAHGPGRLIAGDGQAPAVQLRLRPEHGRSTPASSPSTRT